MGWAPDGKQLAFVTGDRKEIRVASPDGNNAVTKVREARGLLSSLSWAPSDDRFAFIAQDDPTTTGGPGLAVSWSPAGDVFAIDRASGVIEVGNSAGGRRQLVAGREGSWSPDGRFIAFVRSLDAGPTGWIANANGSSPAQVTEAGVCGLSFSSSGNAVAMVT